MKLIGAILVFLSAVMTGTRISLYYKKRETVTEQTLLLIKNIELDLSYQCLPLMRIIEKYASMPTYSALDFLPLCIRKAESGKDIPVCWKESVEQSRIYTEFEKEKLIGLGSFLGTVDTQGQLNILALYENYFASFYSKAKENTERYSKTALITSIIMGFGVFVLIV